jgi:hypothetical protein
MNKAQKTQEVKATLKYLIDEGVIVESSPGMYRVKSVQEQKQELNYFLNE